MKKLYIILAILLIVMLLLGCAGEKTYKVIVYKDKQSGAKIYYAKEIISYTDASVRFIDKKGNEQFVSGDKIKIRQID